MKSMKRMKSMKPKANSGWPTLAGIARTLQITEDEVVAALQELAAHNMVQGVITKDGHIAYKLPHPKRWKR